MMLATLMLVGSLQDAPPPPKAPVSVSVARVQQDSIDIPDEIAPAINPYIRCRLASGGVRVSDGGKPVVPTAAKGADCTAQRGKSAADADRLLRKRGGMSAQARGELIEKTLASADRFVDRAISPDSTFVPPPAPAQ